MPRKAHSLFVFLIAVFTATSAHALSCVSPDMIPEGSNVFKGVMLSAEQVPEEGMSCSLRYTLRVDEVLKGDLQAGDVVQVEKREWICREAERITETKTYELGSEQDGIYKVGMCGSLFHYERKTQGETKE